MTVTLKEFAQFMLEFINKNFVPHIQTGTVQHQKSLQRWRELTDMIRDIQKIHLWNLENTLKSIDARPSFHSDKETKENKKNQNSRLNPITYNTQYNFYDKKDVLPTAYSYEDHPKTNNSIRNNKECSEPRNKAYKYPGSEEYETKLSFESKSGKQKTESVSDPEGFQKLIQSFRKLCTNFQNNHKKLLKQDQNFKENYKEELTQH